MGLMTVSSSAAQTPLGLNTRYSTRVSSSERPRILSFNTNVSKNTALTATRQSVDLPSKINRENRKMLSKVKKGSERVNGDEALSELDYSDAAAKLETIYKTSPATDPSVKRKRNRENGEMEKKRAQNLVRSRRKGKRSSLEKRIASTSNKNRRKNDEDEKIDKLVREYSSSTDLVTLDWKTMKIPPVLPSSEHAWLFKLMQPMKEILRVKETLGSDLGKDITDDELAEETNMDVFQLRRQLEIGRAARNKLIKHNLRLVLFVMNKYFQHFTNGPRFQDLCQAGVKGLITAIDRFEPKRKFRLSTYSLFWIRHTIVRSMTLSSFTKVPFGLESVRVEIQRAKQELFFELQREPTEQEIIDRVGISPERYHEVMRASKPIASLHARHGVTEEEFIDGITDDGTVEGDKRREPARLRLAVDDVLDSLHPKESLVIRQRYGLDGKGDRTLGEIAGNLNISREMVRKHETKALMKLKHPARVDYLRDHIPK